LDLLFGFLSSLRFPSDTKGLRELLAWIYERAFAGQGTTAELATLLVISLYTLLALQRSALNPTIASRVQIISIFILAAPAINLYSSFLSLSL
jgi:hypothetical protein